LEFRINLESKKNEQERRDFACRKINKNMKKKGDSSTHMQGTRWRVPSDEELAETVA